MPATEPDPTRKRSSLRRANAVAAGAFFLGGSPFAIGAGLAQADVGAPRLVAVVYLLGGVFFAIAGYVSVLLAVNAPHRRRDGLWAVRPWRWWGHEPRNVDYLAAVVLFAGTIVFGINLIDALVGQLTPDQEDRLIWNPDVIGCLLFLVSGHLAMVDIRGSWWKLRGEGLGWWIVFVNQVGSVFFMVAAIASFVRPDGDEIGIGIANWSTLVAGIFFAGAGLAQFREAPPGA